MRTFKVTSFSVLVDTRNVYDFTLSSKNFPSFSDGTANLTQKAVRLADRLADKLADKMQKFNT